MGSNKMSLSTAGDNNEPIDLVKGTVNLNPDIIEVIEKTGKGALEEFEEIGDYSSDEQELDSDEDENGEENFIVIGEERPMVEVVRQVIGKNGFQMIPKKMKGLIFLVGNDDVSIKKVIEMMDKDHNQKLIIVDPLNLYSRGMTSSAMVEMSRLSKFPFVRSINEIKTFYVDIAKAIEDFKEIEKTGEHYLKVTNSQKKYASQILGYLQHDLPKTIKIENDNSYSVIEEKRGRFNELVEQGRRAFDMKSHVSEEQIVRFILDTKTQITKVMEGDIDGVYCDIDDTILGKDDEVIEGTLEIIRKLEAKGHKIHIWTGGDPQTQKARLASTPFAVYPVLSKKDYAGATAEIVIDNVSPEKFSLQTGIQAKKFIRV